MNVKFKLVDTSYAKDDVEILLKDLTSDGMQAMSTEEREKLIQSGVHYSEMLPLEYVPTPEYMRIYEKTLNEQSHETANAVAVMSEAIIIDKKALETKNIVIVSLARAGIPAGILCKRYINKMYPDIRVKHYSISIIRGRGIDINAMNYIADRECVKDIVFMDGWTGKGAINNVLKAAVAGLKALDNNKWNNLSDELAVIADPSNICRMCGTHEDLMIPSSCLNSTVSGLVSRTILNEKYIDIDAGDFHGAVYFGNNPGMKEADKSYEFINKAVEYFNIYDAEMQDMFISRAKELLNLNIEQLKHGYDIVKHISDIEDIDDLNKIKPGIGECTRVLLRRVPDKVLINSNYVGNKDLEHIFRLCDEKHVKTEVSNEIGEYKTVGIIKKLSDA